MKTTPPSHQICPVCHTPIALARYEFASDDQHTWRICPECDHTLLMTDEAAETLVLGVRPTAATSKGVDVAPAVEPLHA